MRLFNGIICRVYSIYLKIRFKNKLSIPKKCIVNKDTKILIGSGSIIIGNGMNARRNLTLSCASGQLIIGSRVHFNINCLVACRSKIVVEDECIFGPNVCIYDHDHLFDENGIDNFSFSYKDVHIGRNCWIGAGAIILKGTDIGEGSIVGAGTVVKGFIPPHSIVTNNRDLEIRPILKREII